MKRLGLVVAVAGCAGAPCAQPERFERSYAQAEAMRLTGGDAEAVREAYRAAVAAFESVDRERDASYRNGALAAGAFAAYQAGIYARALEWLDEALERGQVDAFTTEYQVRTLLALGEHDRALRSAHRLGAPFDLPIAVLAELQDAAAEALRHGDTERGLWLFEQVAREGDPIALGNHGLALRSVGRLDEGERTYRRALDLAPDDSILWNDYGLFLKGVGRIDEAVGVLRRSLELEQAPFDGPAAGNLVALTLHGVDTGVTDPAGAVARVLASRPDSEISRRRCIDSILAAHRDARERDG